MAINFVGQARIVRELKGIQDALQRDRNESLNILLRGPAGCGKTKLAQEFCKPFGKHAYQIIEKDFVLTESTRFQIIDEIHMLKNYEQIYEYMDAEVFVFIFCTTDSGILSDPFSSRCLQFTFDEYSEDEIAKIAYAYSLEIKLNMAMDTAKLIARMSRGSPRFAKNYVKRIRFMIMSGYHPMTLGGVKSAFKEIGVYNGGYTAIDMSYLNFIQKVGTTSLKMISRSIKVDEDTIKNEIEPFLIEKGHIQISSRGRKFLSWETGEENGRKILTGI